MPFERIVVGVDFSTASLNAVRWVAGQFAPSAHVFVVHVVAEPRIPAFLREQQGTVPSPGSEEEALYPGLRVFAELAGAGRSNVELRTGSPSTELARVAREVDADLVCVGRTRSRRGSGRFGATTPQRLLSRTRVPVLIVPETARMLPRAVLAAISDGDDSRAVLHWAGRLAAAWRGRLDALHVIEPDVLAALGGSAAPSESRLCHLAERWIAGQLSELAQPELQRGAVARVGHAGEEAIAYAVCNEIGLIVAGRRTHDDAVEESATDPGSTTRLITWASSCPVLILGPGTAAVPGNPRPAEDGGGWLLSPSPRLAVAGRGGTRTFRRPHRSPPGGDDAA